MHMTPDDFARAYEHALGTQDWKTVEPLVHRDACVTFSSGAVHEGREAVQAAFTRNFAAIKSEEYGISNLRWIHKDAHMAVGLFDFTWKGIINGGAAAGSGRGTHVLVNKSGRWLLLAKHLGPRPA
jgi:ketosteroid isomerase-like protein